MNISIIIEDRGMGFLVTLYMYLNITHYTDLWFEDNTILRVQMNLEIDLCKY